MRCRDVTRLLLLFSIYSTRIEEVAAVGRQNKRQQHIMSMHHSINPPQETCSPSLLYDAPERKLPNTKEIIENPEAGELISGEQLDDREERFFHVLNDPPYMGRLHNVENEDSVSVQPRSFADAVIDFFSRLGEVGHFSSSFLELLGASVTSQAKAQIGSWNRVTDAIISPQFQSERRESKGTSNPENDDDMTGERSGDSVSLSQKSDSASLSRSNQEDGWKQWRSSLVSSIKNFFDRLDKRIEEAGGHVMLMDFYDAPL